MRRMLGFLLSMLTFMIVAACGQPIPEINDAFLIGVTPASDFQQNGEVRFSILPKDGKGEAIIRSGIKIKVLLNRNLSEAYSVSIRDIKTIEPRTGQNLAALLSIDSSISMLLNDPDELRKVAAKQFVNQLGANDQVAVCDFGAGRTAPFEDTRLLQDFTSDKEKAKAAIDKIRALNGTPMYNSLLETLDFFQNKFPGQNSNRVLILLGDGKPSERSGMLEEVCNKAKNTGIPIHTIGFGPAADQSQRAQDEAVKVLRQLANCSGGNYTGVVEATELQDAFRKLGEASKEGQVEILVKYSPVPKSNTLIKGTLQISNGEQIQPVILAYTFVAP